MRGLGRRLVNFFIGMLVGKFGAKELVLDAFFLPSIYRLIPVEINKGNGVADSRF